MRPTRTRSSRGGGRWPRQHQEQHGDEQRRSLTHCVLVLRARCGSDPGRTRTCNLWFRGPTPYPLGHRACRNDRKNLARPPAGAAVGLPAAGPAGLTSLNGAASSRGMRVRNASQRCAGTSAAERMVKQHWPPPRLRLRVRLRLAQAGDPAQKQAAPWHRCGRLAAEPAPNTAAPQAGTNASGRKRDAATVGSGT